MKYKKTMITLAVGALSLSAVTLASAQQSNLEKVKSFFKKLKPGGNRVELLFLQQADAGSILPNAKKAGCYTLTLSNLHKNLLYFSDQPKRKAGKISIKGFIEAFKHDKVTPNVAMQAFSVNQGEIKEVNLVATLSDPQYNAQKEEMTYTACPIKSSSKLSSYKNLRSVNLFIDPIKQWPP